jgi:formylglycine-generating enzyme required for sulfatase activity
MVRVPGGTFWMGSVEGVGDADERPQRRVTLSGYCVDETEVTVEGYGRCVGAGVCAPAPTTVEWPGITEADRTLWSQWCNGSRKDRGTHPVNCVNWEQARGYCEWVGKRLPTEAEWEYAARGTDGRTYPWGEEAPGPGRLNACGAECRAMLEKAGSSGSAVMYEGDDGWGGTAPVGSFPAGASPYGALDLAGNVWEWVADWYGEYPAGEAENPTGPSSGEARALRGGGWLNADAGVVRAADRLRGGPAYRIFGLGFRCARGD